MNTTKKDIRALSKEELRTFFTTNGDKAFRGTQVYEWLWQKGAHHFDDMTNLSKETRQMMDDNFSINHIKVDSMQRSSDGTIKNGIRLHDGMIVESVLIPTRKVKTVFFWAAHNFLQSYNPKHVTSTLCGLTWPL